MCLERFCVQLIYIFSHKNNYDSYKKRDFVKAGARREGGNVDTRGKLVT